MGNYLLGFLDKSDGDDGKPVDKKDQNENIGEPTPNGRRRNSRRLKIQDPSVDFTKLTDLGASVESNEKGERVVYVETDGPFKKWGIKSGDRLVRMNSKDLTRMDSFAIEKCFQSTKKSELKVHVKRQKSNEKPIPEETETVLKQENSQMVINKNLVRETEECDIIEFHVLWTFFNWIQKFLEPLLGSGPVISHENNTDVNLLPYSNSPTTILKLARKQEIVPHTMRKKKYLVKMHHYKHRIGSNVPGTLVILEFLKKRDRNRYVSCSMDRRTQQPRMSLQSSSPLKSNVVRPEKLKDLDNRVFYRQRIENSSYFIFRSARHENLYLYMTNGDEPDSKLGVISTHDLQNDALKFKIVENTH